MKTSFLLLALLAGTAAAQTYVQPHVRKDGTFVPGHYRSAPDRTPINNYSTQGNYNPYTGQAGTVNPYAAPAYPPPAWQSPYSPQRPACTGWNCQQ
jgi:hypothetical protein